MQKEYTMNKITCDHTPFAQACVLTRAHDCKHALVLDLTHVQSTCILQCTHVQYVQVDLLAHYAHIHTAINRLRMSLCRFFKPTAL